MRATGTSAAPWSRGTGCVAIVLAGGRSSRFGSDKLRAPVAGVPLLELTLAGLPATSDVIVVGPERPLTRAARFVREDPPFAGPTAALLAGLRSALETEAEVERMVVLPGDAPGAGAAADRLLRALDRGPADVVVGTDTEGNLQPLQLALRRSGAVRLLAAAGPAAGRNASARRLITSLDPPAHRVELPATGWFDVDTADQLAVQRALPAASALLGAADERRSGQRSTARPIVVALDGRSGAGKSTLAAATALCRPATVIDGDDFYSSELPALSAPAPVGWSDREIADRVIDWRRLRGQALEPLTRGESARYRPYDWEAGDGRLGAARELEPTDLIVLEGVYSARPELADLVDVSVYVDVDPAVRGARLARREHDPLDWADFWERGERAYFGDIRRPDSFDLMVSTDDLRNAAGT